MSLFRRRLRLLDRRPRTFQALLADRRHPVHPDRALDPGQAGRVVVGEHAGDQHPPLVDTPPAVPPQSHGHRVCPTCGDPTTAPGRCPVCRATGVTA